MTDETNGGAPLPFGGLRIDFGGDVDPGGSGATATTSATGGAGTTGTSGATGATSAVTNTPDATGAIGAASAVTANTPGAIGAASLMSDAATIDATGLKSDAATIDATGLTGSAGVPAIAFAPVPDAAPGFGGSASAARGGGPVESKVVIVGSGPAGLTAAIYAARASLEPIVLAGTTPGGQLTITSEVENYPGFPEGIQGPDLMAAFRAQAERFGTRLIDVDVDRVDFSGRPFGLWAAGVEYRAQAVIVATGASAIWLGLPSEERLRGRGVSACATCDGFFFRDREIAVVGGGDSAFEEATFLTRFASKVHLLHRRSEFRASRIMIERASEDPKIEFHPNTTVEEVLGDEQVTGLRLRDTVTGEVREVPMEGLFIAIGHRPNTAAFADWLEVDEKGYLVVHDETRSRVDGVFVAGDVHDHRYRQAITAAGDGCRAAIDAERWLEAQGIAEARTATAW